MPDDAIIGNDPLTTGVTLSLRLRRDFTVTDAGRLLAATRRVYRELEPAASAETEPGGDAAGLDG